jgi:predicted NBD/HSP70 family sugar kinase
MMRAPGIDFRRTKALACLLDGEGRVLVRAARPTGRGTGPAALGAGIAGALGAAQLAGGMPR